MDPSHPDDDGYKYGVQPGQRNQRSGTDRIPREQSQQYRNRRHGDDSGDDQLAGKYPRRKEQAEACRDGGLYHHGAGDIGKCETLLALPRAAADCRKAWGLAHEGRIAGVAKDNQLFDQFIQCLCGACTKDCGANACAAGGGPMPTNAAPAAR